MTGRLHRSIRYISGTLAALLFGLASTSVFASDPDSSACDKIGEAPQGVEIPSPSRETPSLQVRLVDYGATDSASDDMKAPAADPADEKLTSAELAADASETSLTDSEDDSAAETESAVDKLPKTSLRLPGVSEKDAPQFRRQMYRTDI